MRFEDPWLFFLAPMVFGFILFAHRRIKTPGIRFSNGQLFTGLPKSLKTKFAQHILLIRGVSSILILLALARPQSVIQETRIETEGVDIMVVLDVSTSMLAEDFNIDTKRTSRIEAAKTVIRDFIRGREADRIGMVIFAERAYMICPLTLDHDWLLKNLERVGAGMIEDNTAIGSGLSSALNRLKDSVTREKAIILLTDGRNNAGKITPEEAASAARTLNIKVYTTGIGSKGLAPFPAMDPFGNKIYRSIRLDMDEDLLNKIATQTEARYFRATNMTSLREIFQEIDRLEKSPIKEERYNEYGELFPLFLIPGLILLLLEIILKRTYLRRIP